MNTLAEWMEWVEARATRDGAHLIWKQSYNGNQPQGGVKVNGKKLTVNVRRKLWELKTGRKARRAYVVVCKCEEHGCVEPKCLKEISRSDLLSGKPISATHKIKLTLAARSRVNVKVDQAAVDDIRAAGLERAQEKADEYGISLRHAQGIINGRWWRDLANPFAALVPAGTTPKRKKRAPKPGLRAGEMEALGKWFINREGAAA